MYKSLIIILILSVCLIAVAAADQTELIVRQTAQGCQYEHAVQPMSIQEEIIAYDSAPAVYWSGLTDEGTMFSVRFTPPQPCSLSYIQIVSYGVPGEAKIHIFTDDDGTPGEDLITPFIAYFNTDIQYQRIDLPSPINVGLDDFHIAVEYTIQAGIGPYVTGDNDGVTEDRSLYKTPENNNWTVVTVDLNFRAGVIYYGNDQVAPAFVHAQQIFGFTQDSEHVLSAEITDAAGVASADIHYSSDGINWAIIAMTNISGDTWEGAIPSQETGSTIFYYLSAIDNSLYSNEGFEPPAGENDPYPMDIIDGAEIFYDDGTPEAWWIVDTSYNDNAFAIKMTPSSYPAQILMARAFVSDDTPFTFTVNSVSASLPGDVLSGGEDVPAVRQEHGWAIGEWANGPVIYSGSFFLILHWNPETPGDPGVGQDTDNLIYHSYWYHGDIWNTSAEGEWIMRCIVHTSIGIEELSSDIMAPAEFALAGNYPNPFNPSTEIKFAAPVSGNVTIEIFNIAGQLIKNVFNGNVNAGIHSVNWNAADNSGNNVSSGVYYYKLTAGDRIDTKKMVLLK